MTASTPVPDAAPEPDLSHAWIGAAFVTLTEKLAKHAAFRGSYRTKEPGVRIDVLDVYCSLCRRPYDDAADQPCAAKINNEHLIGGNQAERKKRKIAPPAPGAVIEPGPRLNRMGVVAIASGGATFNR